MLIVGFLLLPLVELNAQSNNKELLKGIKLVHNERYKQALPILENVITKEPKNAKALYYFGVCNLQLSHNKKGMDFLKKGLSIDPDIDKEHQLYWLGLGYHYNYKFDDAISVFTKLKKNLHKNDIRIDYINKFLKEIAHAKEHQKVRPEYYVENLEGGVNSKHSEHSPLISSNGRTLYFTSRQNKLIGKKEKMGDHYMEDIMISTIDNNLRWSTPSLLSSNVINDNRHEASVQLFENDTKMIVYKHKRNGDLYIIEKDKNSWSKPLPFDKDQINTKHFESHGFLLPDGNTIYFTSSRFGDLDIFKSTKDDNGKWTEAVMLSTEINTSHDEDAPFITADGKTMYFSSTGHNSIGGFDIFISHFDEHAGKWGKAKQLSPPINTPQDDMYLVMDKTDTFGFFASNRAGGKGEKDIYKLGRIFPFNVKGLVASESTKKPLKDIKLSFFDEKYNEKKICDNNDAGNYTTELNCNATYKVSFFSNDYKEGEEAFHQDNIELPISKKRGNTYDKNFFLPESALVKLLRNYTLEGLVSSVVDTSPMNGVVQIKNNNTNKIFESKITDGKFNLLLKAALGDDCSISVTRSDDVSYPNIGSFKTSTEALINKDLILNTDNATTTSNQTTIKKELKFVNFDFDKSKLTNATKKILNKIAKYPDEEITRIILIGHTDNTGSDSYNEKLSKRRVKGVLKYLLKKGIARKKISLVFEGEKSPIASNDTDAGQSKNRRVEIKIN